MKLITFLILMVCFGGICICQNSEQFYNIGLELSSGRDNYGAIESFTKAIDLTLFESDNQARKKILENFELKKKVANYFLSRGLAKFEIQDFIGAQKDFYNVTMLLPNFPEGHFQKAKSYYALGIYDLAKYGFDEALNLEPNDAEAYFRRGLTNYELESFEESIDDYTKALEIHCCPAEAYYQRGRAKNRLGDVSGANDDQTKAIERDANFTWAYQERGLGKMQIEDFQGAMQDFNVSISIEPDARTYRSRGLLKIILKDFRGAIADCTESIKLDPNFPAAYMTRGMAKIQLKQKEEGCLDLSKAGELGLTNAY